MIRFDGDEITSLGREAKVTGFFTPADELKKLVGQYEDAIDYLSKFNTSDILVGAAKYSTLGDSYVELQDYSGAISMYRKGIDKYSNTFSGPILLKKLGIVYEETGELSKALDTYKEIEILYPESQEGREIKKYIGRVEAKMAL